MAEPTRPSRRPLLLFAALGLAGTVIILFSITQLMAAGEPDFHGTAYHDGSLAPEFTLIDHRGQAASLSDFRGEAVLLFFGFTHCPDVCPLTLSRLHRALDDLGRRGQDVRIVLVTVDPERDTPDVLAEYISHFGDRVVALTGSEDALASVFTDYGVYVEEGEAGSGHAGHGSGSAGQELAHSSAVYGIDREGRLRVVIPYEHPEEWIRDDVRTLLRL